MLDDRRRVFRRLRHRAIFDGRFQGEVSAPRGVANSLNVPAVAVLERVGPSRFIAGLASCGIRPSRPAAECGEPGLAIALGGAGITLSDLAMPVRAALFAKRRGRAIAFTEPTRRPAAATPLFVRWRLVRQRHPGRGAGATRNVAGEVKRSRPLSRSRPAPSYGFRDAWAVGYDREVTIAVWAGRPTAPRWPGRKWPRHRRARPVQDRRSARPVGRQANG